jgi:hypothetical protein
MQADWGTMLSYLTHDPRWFEDMGRRPVGAEHLQEYRQMIDPRWSLTRRGYWMLAEPPETERHEQGWKIHVSASSRNSVQILRTALPVLREAGVPFKFLADQVAVRESNSKSYARGASGKFITVYPRDPEEFYRLASSLTETLSGFDGPYVLSDRRCPGSNVVSYRYGGFASPVRRTPLGVRELMIRDPQGALVPDVRHPYWSKAPWATDPFAPPSPKPAEAGSGLLNDRYQVLSAVQFSNRGGIYRGIDTHTGADVILREARPGVEIGAQGRDAVEVLRHEHDLLRELSDTGLFVLPLDYFTQGNHAFLVEEFVEGTHLGHLSISQNPVYTKVLTGPGMRDYYERFTALWAQVAAAVAVCHERGIVLRDLSPTNIMVTPDDRIRIIDLESAFHDGRDEGAGLSTPGMITQQALRAGQGDRRSDLYALGGVLLCCVLACHQADAVEPAIPRRLLTQVAADLALPQDLVSLIEELRDEDAPAPDARQVQARLDGLSFTGTWTQSPPLAVPAGYEPSETERLHKEIAATVAGAADYLRATADLSRTDRLFPADLLVFQTNPLSLAHGAYGPLYALHTVGEDIPGTLLSWALQRSTAESAMPAGLYYGTAGVAWAQSALGLPEVGAQTLREAAAHPLLVRDAGVLTGAAGHGLACLRLWRDTGAGEFLDQARILGSHLEATADRRDDRACWPKKDTTPIGYGEGASGIALFLLSLYAATGEERWLELGRAGLEFDLAHSEYSPNGVLSFPAFAPTDGLPSPILKQYWDEGTAGILAVVLRYHQITGEAALRTWIDKLLPDVRRKYTVFPQLFHGLSGIGNTLLDAYEFLGEAELLTAAEHAATTVLCSAVERAEGIVFPGEQTLRESADLATGSAGVMLFLDRVAKARPGARTNANFVLDDLVLR